MRVDSPVMRWIQIRARWSGDMLPRIYFSKMVQSRAHSECSKIRYYQPKNQQYYTIIDFNEVDIRIYLPEKVIFHQGRWAKVNITFKGK